MVGAKILASIVSINKYITGKQTSSLPKVGKILKNEEVNF